MSSQYQATGFHMNRRGALASLLAISASGALAACGSAEEVAADASNTDVLRYARGVKFFSDEEMAKMSAMADTIIPTTDTPGAVAAGVPDTLQGLASEWGDDAYRKYWREGVAKLSGDLDAMAGEDFAALPAAARERVLGQHDAKVFGGEAEDQFYKDFKRTVATAYYMSEPGATEELAYEAVPGQWIGVAPLSEYPKTWAT